MKKNILDKIKGSRLYFDGGTGTLVSHLLPVGEGPEYLNLHSPKVIENLHLDYLLAGADIIKTNTFGVNPLKDDDYKEHAESAMASARAAIEKCGEEDKYIAFDIGPTGKLLLPLGDLSFESAVSAFSAMAREAERLGADLILIETMNDANETRAALIGAREGSSLPVFVTNAYDGAGKLMTGADPMAMTAILEALGASAIGINCSQGPDKMAPIVEKLLKYSSVPVIVNANAGLPSIVNGSTVYGMDADAFSESVKALSESGAHILGGCCGTTPEYIKAVKEKTKDIPYKYPKYKEDTLVSSYTHALAIGERPLLIGERINPTGKKKLKEALREKNYEYILGEAVREADAGAHILDVNAGLPEIDEGKVLEELVYEIQSISDLPLQLDSSNPEALRRAARIYNGKALINSVNASRDSMDKILPIAKKYGSAIIGLTVDEGGIPETADGRVELALKIIAEANKYGIPRKDVIIDPLTLSVSADENAARVTLSAVRKLHALGIRTSLGVSNVSFGLPMRDKINSSFFSHALISGLDLAIMNPLSELMMDAYYSYSALFGYDSSFESYIAYADKDSVKTEKIDTGKTVSLEDAIISGISNLSATLARELLMTYAPIDIINDRIIPALNTVGADFEAGRIYLPRLLAAADAASAAFKEVKERMPASDIDSSRSVVLATVKGDIHDIGKNIVKVMLESYGFKVYDLGRDVSAESVLSAAREYNSSLIGLSALMTTTVGAMEDTVALIHKELPGASVMVGGAVLNAEYADMIGADFYAPDAMGAVRIAESFYQNAENKKEN